MTSAKFSGILTPVMKKGKQSTQLGFNLGPRLRELAFVHGLQALFSRSFFAGSLYEMRKEMSERAIYELVGCCVTPLYRTKFSQPRTSLYVSLCTA